MGEKLTGARRRRNGARSRPLHEKVELERPGNATVTMGRRVPRILDPQRSAEPDTVSALSFSLAVSAANSNHQKHPWVEALETFGIAFFVYGVGAERRYTSTAASDLMRGSVVQAIGPHADRIAAEAILGRPQSAGARGFRALREVSGCGGLVLSVHIACPAIDDIYAIVIVKPATVVARADAPVEGLTPRESEVAHLIAGGLSSNEIAGRLRISTHTARHHAERVYAKLGVRRRGAGASLLGARLGGVAAVAAL